MRLPCWRESFWTMQKNDLNRFLSDLVHPVAIETDATGILLGWEGDIDWYGLKLDNEEIGKPAQEIIPMLFGLDFSTAQELPLVSFGINKTANIYIQPNGAGRVHVFLVDARQQMAALRNAQQTRNETSLLFEKLSRLSELLKQKNTKLQQAINARSQFLSGVSHEFRTPITTILGHINILVSQCRNISPDINTSFQTIDKNAKYLLALIDNLLEQGEITAQRLTITKSAVDLELFFQFIIDTFSVIAEQKQIKLLYRKNFADDLRILADEHHLYLMMVNLISNAIKFTDFGSIQISADWSNNQLKISVKDTGIGIPEAELRKITEPFSRGSNVGQRKGSGLGLSIIREVIKAMEGELDFQSKQGAGTLVSLQIPAKAALHERAAENNSKAENITRPPRVLIVEDDHDISTLYSILLRDAGMEPLCFDDGKNLLGNLEKHDPDLIILDYNLGNENGIELAAKVRKSGYEKPVILFTATSIIDMDLKEKAATVGCTRVLNKPHDVNSLTQIISLELEKMHE